MTTLSVLGRLAQRAEEVAKRDGAISSNGLYLNDCCLGTAETLQQIERITRVNSGSNLLIIRVTFDENSSRKHYRRSTKTALSMTYAHIGQYVNMAKRLCTTLEETEIWAVHVTWYRNV